MPETESGALERGREAFERRTWGVPPSTGCDPDARGSLIPADLERLGEAARWSDHFDEMLDTFERASRQW
jgi:hypothetical protein